MEISYDGRGRVTNETRRIGTWTFPTLYSYTSADLVRTLTYPDNEVVTYTYNAAGQPIAASGVQGGVTTPYLTSQSFDIQGRSTHVQFGNTVSNRYWYYSAAGDSRLNRLSQLLTQTAANAVLSDLRYDYDRLGNVTAVDTYTAQGTLDAVESQRYRYDSLSRLVEVKTAEASPRLLESFSYTDLGNLLTRGSVSYSYTAGKPHAVTHVSSDPASRFGYDNAGNMTTRGSQSLLYDAEGRLTKVQWGGADLEEYTYDGNGTLIRRKLAAQTQQTLHSQDFTSQGTGWTSGWSGSGSVTWNQNPNDSSGHTSAVRLTGNGVDWGVQTYRNGTLGDRQQARVAFKLSQVGTGAVIALETTDANYYVGLYEEAGALKLRTRVGGSFSNPALLMSAVQANTWYVLELAADHAAGMRVSVWAESNSGTRYEARAEAVRSMSWRFHAWVKQGQMWLDGSQGDGYRYVEERPALSGADSRLVGKHYEYDSVSAQTTKRYYVGGRLIATRTGSAVRYVHADHLGSTTTLTNESEKMGREWAGWIGSDRNMRTSDPAHPLYPRPSFLTRLGNNV